MTYRIIPLVKHGGDSDYTVYRLANSTGNLARTTEGSVFVTGDRRVAEQVMDYLNQPHDLLHPRAGSHKMKSLFG